MPNRMPSRRQIILGLSTCLIATASIAAARSDPIAAVVHAPTRTPAMVTRDAARHPEAVLRFFGIGPRSRVVELWPAAGYWTEMLSPLTDAHGGYLAALGRKGGSEGLGHRSPLSWISESASILSILFCRNLNDCDGRTA